MGIEVEFNPDLALRDFGTTNRAVEECIPERLIEDETYPFLKKGLRNYYLKGEIPLVITTGNQQLSRPIAAIIILEATHFLRNGEVYTRGIYEVKRVLDPKNSRIHFEGMKLLN